MLIKKSRMSYIMLIIFAVYIVFLILWFTMEKEKKMIIEVEGFEVEYKLAERKITIEDFNNIKIGSSIYEISQEIGEPDTWVGSGMLRPVYFLTDYRVIVLHFKYPAACDDLRQIVCINEKGESQIIKE